MRKDQLILTGWLAFAFGFLLATGIQLAWWNYACEVKIERAIQLEEELNEIAPLPPRPQPQTSRRT